MFISLIKKLSVEAERSSRPQILSVHCAGIQMVDVHVLLGCWNCGNMSAEKLQIRFRDERDRFIRLCFCEHVL